MRFRHIILAVVVLALLSAGVGLWVKWARDRAAFRQGVKLNILEYRSADAGRSLAVMWVFEGRGIERRATPKTVQALRYLLEDPNPTVRAGAAAALGVIAYPTVDFGEEIIPLLQDEEDLSRRAAAVALGCVGGDRGQIVAALASALRDSDAEARRAAAESLGWRGPQAHASIPDLVRALKDSEQDVRHAAAEALAQVARDSPVAVEALRSAIESAAGMDRLIFATALWQVSSGQDPKIPVLVLEMLASPDPEVRAAAARFFAERCPPTEGALAALRNALKDNSATVRLAVVEALGPTVNTVPDLVAPLLTLTADKDRAVRKAAITALGGMAALSDERVTDALADRLLNDPDADVRRTCALILARKKEAPARAVEALRAATADPNADVAGAAWRSLIRLGHWQACLRRCLEELTAADGRVRANAASTLIALGKQAGPALPSLLRTLKDPNAEVRLRAALALGSIANPADKNVVQALRSLSKDPSPRVVIAGLKARLRLSDEPEECQRQLVRLTSHPKANVRIAAIQALPALSGVEEMPPAMYEALLRALDDPSNSVVRAAAQKLSQLRTFDARMARRLVELGGRHPLATVREECLSALVRRIERPDRSLLDAVEAVADREVDPGVRQAARRTARAMRYRLGLPPDTRTSQEKRSNEP